MELRGNQIMISLFIGLFIGSAISLILYSTIAGERINSLECQNERRYRSGEESWHRGSVVAKKK